jgi:hypothetical protein
MILTSLWFFCMSRCTRCRTQVRIRSHRMSATIRTLIAPLSRTLHRRASKRSGRPLHRPWTPSKTVAPPRLAVKRLWLAKSARISRGSQRPAQRRVLGATPLNRSAGNLIWTHCIWSFRVLHCPYWTVQRTCGLLVALKQCGWSKLEARKQLRLLRQAPAGGSWEKGIPLIQWNSEPKKCCNNTRSWKTIFSA